MKDCRKLLQCVDTLCESIELLRVEIEDIASSSEEKGRESLVSIGDFAKMLRDMGMPLGRNKLYSWLLYRGFTYRKHDRNYAKSEYVKKGYFYVKGYVVNSKTGTSLRETIYLTPLGVKFFTDMIFKELGLEMFQIGER